MVFDFKHIIQFQKNFKEKNRFFIEKIKEQFLSQGEVVLTAKGLLFYTNY